MAARKAGAEKRGTQIGIHITITPAQKERLKQIKSEWGVNHSEVIRVALVLLFNLQREELLRLLGQSDKEEE